MKGKKFKLAVFVGSVVILLVIINLYGQTRGVTVKVNDENGQSKEIKLYEGSYALVIGESNYTNGWDMLPGVENDIAAVQKVLKRSGFNVEKVENLTSRQLVDRVKQFIDEYGYQTNNRLLIYFAGHGHTQKAGDGRDLGYIIPVDTPVPDKDDLGFRRKAISMETIQSFAKQIEAKHALFVFDSCFSGKLITRERVTVPPIIQEDIAYPVRQFITAGAANQSVPDDSIFRKAFVRALEGEADRNGDGYITGSELADYLKEKVTNSTDRAQTPQYGKIRDIDLDRGDFVFVIPKGNFSASADPDIKIADSSTDKLKNANVNASVPGRKPKPYYGNTNTNISFRPTPTPSPTPPDQIVDVGVMNSRAVSLVKPCYSAIAKQGNASGEVRVQITVDKEGNVTSALAISGHSLLRPCAEMAARQTRFNPITVGGRAVEARGFLDYDFINK